jgi:hypothetical protein
MFSVSAGTIVCGRALDWNAVFFQARGLALLRHACFRKICPAERTGADLARASLVVRLGGVLLAAPSRDLLLARQTRPLRRRRPAAARQKHFGTHLIWLPYEYDLTNAAHGAFEPSVPVSSVARAIDAAPHLLVLPPQRLRGSTRLRGGVIMLRDDVSTTEMVDAQRGARATRKRPLL